MNTLTATTKRKIGKITYLVSAAPSGVAKDTLGKKIEKMILKDIGKIANY